MFENDATPLRRRPSRRYVNSAGQWIRLDQLLPRSTPGPFFLKRPRGRMAGRTAAASSLQRPTS